MSEKEKNSDESGTGAESAGSTDDVTDDVVVVDRSGDSRTYSGNEEAIEQETERSIDPIGIGIAVVIVVIAGGLLLVGPLSGTAGQSTSAPDTDFKVVRINDSHVQIAHVGGDNVAGDRLSVVVDSEERSPGWPNTVTDGDVVLIQADANSTITLFWAGPEKRTTIGNWTI